MLERLGALGLLSAIGFTVPRLRLVVVLETVLMVLLGLAVGTLAGCLAVVPAFTDGHAVVPAGWIAWTWAVTLLAAVAAGLAAAGRVSRLDPARLLAAAE
ncbi:MAG: FtsX-like permease family protein [Planctomycetia bacterium]